MFPVGPGRARRGEPRRAVDRDVEFCLARCEVGGFVLEAEPVLAAGEVLPDDGPPRVVGRLERELPRPVGRGWTVRAVDARRVAVIDIRRGERPLEGPGQQVPVGLGLYRYQHVLDIDRLGVVVPGGRDVDRGRRGAGRCVDTEPREECRFAGRDVDLHRVGRGVVPVGVEFDGPVDGGDTADVRDVRVDADCPVGGHPRRCVGDVDGQVGWVERSDRGDIVARDAHRDVDIAVLAVRVVEGTALVRPEHRLAGVDFLCPDRAVLEDGPGRVVRVRDRDVDVVGGGPHVLQVVPRRYPSLVGHGRVATREPDGEHGLVPEHPHGGRVGALAEGGAAAELVVDRRLENDLLVGGAEFVVCRPVPGGLDTPCLAVGVLDTDHTVLVVRDGDGHVERAVPAGGGQTARGVQRDSLCRLTVPGVHPDREVVLGAVTEHRRGVALSLAAPVLDQQRDVGDGDRVWLVEQDAVRRFVYHQQPELPPVECTVLSVCPPVPRGERARAVVCLERLVESEFGLGVTLQQHLDVLGFERVTALVVDCDTLQRDIALDVREQLLVAAAEVPEHERSGECRQYHDDTDQDDYGITRRKPRRSRRG